MVDNRGISPLSNIGFNADNASANKMSDEKQGQGGEYFASEMQEEENQEQLKNNYQDRSAQLRASLNGLAMANAASIMFMKTLKKKEEENRKKHSSQQQEDEEEIAPEIYDE